MIRRGSLLDHSAVNADHGTGSEVVISARSIPWTNPCRQPILERPLKRPARFNFFRRPRPEGLGYGKPGLPAIEQALARSVYNTDVEKTVRIFDSFKDADQADARADAALTPEQRLKIVLELRDRRHPDAAEQRLARVSRVVELGDED